jgi:hypothetical protein
MYIEGHVSLDVQISRDICSIKQDFGICLILYTIFGQLRITPGSMQIAEATLIRQAYHTYLLKENKYPVACAKDSAGQVKN